MRILIEKSILIAVSLALRYFNLVISSVFSSTVFLK